MTPDVYHSLTLCGIMIGILSAFYWYGEVIKPMVPHSQRAKQLSEQYKLSPIHAPLIEKMLNNHNYRPVLYVPFAHAVVLLAQIILYFAHGSNIYSTLFMTSLATGLYFYILYGVISSLKSIPMIVKDIISAIKENDEHKAFVIMTEYPKMRFNDFIELAYLTNSADFANYVINNYPHTLKEQDLREIMNQFCQKFEISPINALSDYKWQEEVKHTLIDIMKP